MAALPMGEVSRPLAERFGGSFSRLATVPADAMTFAYHMQSALHQTLEAHLKPLRPDPKVALDRDQWVAGTVGGKEGPEVLNIAFSAHKWFQPGIAVAMRHHKKRVTQVRITARVTTMWAVVAGILVGAVVEWLWFPWFGPNFFHWPTWFTGLYIAAIGASGIFFYWLFVRLTNTVFISTIVVGICFAFAVAVSFVWGFLAGYALAWTVVTRTVGATSGAPLRQQLRKAVDDAAEAILTMRPPQVYAPVPYWPAPPVATSYVGPPPGAVPATYVQRPGYSYPILTPVPPPPPPPPRVPPAPTTSTRHAPAPKVQLKTARVAQGAPAPTPSAHPCPTCGAPLPSGAPHCRSCGTAMVWD